jgi:hypothetical protein
MRAAMAAVGAAVGAAVCGGIDIASKRLVSALSSRNMAECLSFQGVAAAGWLVARRKSSRFWREVACLRGRAFPRESRLLVKLLIMEDEDRRPGGSGSADPAARQFAAPCSFPCQLHLE